jgi:hypothetical protein
METYSPEWRKAHSEALRAGQRELAKNGRFYACNPSRLPYGYGFDWSKTHLVPIVREQRILGVVRRLRQDGLSLRKIARHLEQRGHMARNGKPFTASKIRAMCLPRMVDLRPDATSR